MLDALPEWLKGIAGYLSFVLAGGFLFLLGNLVFGWKQEGGRRLFLFVAGIGALCLAESARACFWPAFAIQDYPKALGMLVPICLFPFGGLLVVVALFCHNDWVRIVFSAILRGI
ncbi:MAG: hypothetical protein JNL39_13055 [Opitutaceae bacterium]|nr:hypothetical protein [Opitutaceae bacterium]